MAGVLHDIFVPYTPVIGFRDETDPHCMRAESFHLNAGEGHSVEKNALHGVRLQSLGRDPAGNTDPPKERS